MNSRPMHMEYSKIGLTAEFPKDFLLQSDRDTRIRNDKTSE